MLGPDGLLLEDPLTVLDRSQLTATTASHPLPPRALDGDDAVWRAFVELERPAAGAAAPTGR
jgi:hypothetical protein